MSTTTTDDSTTTAAYNVLVKLITGHTLTLKFTTPSITPQTLFSQITNHCHHLTRNHLLLAGNRQFSSTSETPIPLPPTDSFLTVTQLGRLLGGKGGFGSLLRGAATKAGQKKTNNFDACRDMSGRRLRHVNAEKRLEEWKEGEEERKMEKVAEEWCKKRVKEGKRKGEGSREREGEKRVEKYREDSKKCCDAVEVAVRESLKRGGLGMENESAKRLKLWMMKEEEDESDSSDEEEDLAANRKDGEGTSKSVCKIQSSGESSGDSSTLSNTEESSGSGLTDAEASGLVGPVPHKDINDQAAISNLEVVDSFESRPATNEASVFVEEATVGSTSNHDLEKVLTFDAPIPAANMENMEVKRCPESSATIIEAKYASEMQTGSTEKSDMGKPLNFNDFESAKSMEVLGMDRLKSELQLHGLKCGGSLPERAARLFLLKTTPVDKLPKKLLAKK